LQHKKVDDVPGGWFTNGVQTATPVSKRELVKLLVIEHGQKRAAELSGEPYEKVRKWTQRGNWLKSQTVPNGVSATVERISDELVENERKTRLGLSKYAKDAVTELNRRKHKLFVTKEAKDVAQTAAIVHRWDQKDQVTGNVVVNVAILGIDPSEVHVKGVTVDTDTPA
jgi:hypothetical protein